MNEKKPFKKYIVLILIILALIPAYYYLPNLTQFASPTFIREYLLSLGHWGYLIYVLLFVLSIPLPIPSTPLAIAGGYVFGLGLGIILSMIGTVIGSSIAFILIRYYGEPLLEKVVSRKHLHHFNHIFRKRGINGAIIALAIPVFPSDAIEYMLGLTKIGFHAFLWVIILGNIPRMIIVTAFGQGLLTGITLQNILVLVAAAIFLVITVFREKVKKMVFKELRFAEHEVEKELVWVEKEVGEAEEEVGMKRKKRTRKKGKK